MATGSGPAGPEGLGGRPECAECVVGGGQSTRRCIVLVGRALNQESYSLGRALALALTRLASCVSSLGLHFSFCKMELIIPALPCPALPVGCCREQTSATG